MYNDSSKIHDSNLVFCNDAEYAAMMQQYAAMMQQYAASDDNYLVQLFKLAPVTKFQLSRLRVTVADN